MPKPEPYWTRYSNSCTKLAESLSESHRAALQQIDDSLSMDPYQFPEYTVPFSDKIFLYRHPKPKIEVTYRIDREKRTIEYIHIVVPLTETAKLLFISYSHEDIKWLLELKKFLVPLEKSDLVEIWDDQKIQASAQWQIDIEKALESTKAAVLLISQDFLNSDFINKNELPHLLDAADKERLSIFWINVRPSTIDERPEIIKYEAAHHDPPLSKLEESDREEAYVRIFQRIKEAVESR